VLSTLYLFWCHCFNYAQYGGEALRSVLSKEYPNFELSRCEKMALLTTACEVI